MSVGLEHDSNLRRVNPFLLLSHVCRAGWGFVVCTNVGSIPPPLPLSMLPIKQSLTKMLILITSLTEPCMHGVTMLSFHENTHRALNCTPQTRHVTLPYPRRSEEGGLFSCVLRLIDRNLHTSRNRAYGGFVCNLHLNSPRP